MIDITASPFGTEITPDEILDTLGFFDDWEERYKYIIDLGKQLPAIDDSKKPKRFYCVAAKAKCGSIRIL